MRIAGVQLDVRLAENSDNVDTLVSAYGETRSAGSDLTIFPECAITGYCFDSPEEARSNAETVPGPSIERLFRCCGDQGGAMIVGLVEAADGRLFNTAVLLDGTGVLMTYRKTHLPYLGVDRFTDYGQGVPEVCEWSGLRVGMHICYDAAFPESARGMALDGADLIALPTNWPPGAENAAECLVNARALENTVYYAAINRVGVERGVEFVGRSRIADPLGRTIVQAMTLGREVLYADIDPEKARRKHLIRVAGENEVDRIADRRPDLYERLTQGVDMLTPRQRANPAT